MDSAIWHIFRTHKGAEDAAVDFCSAETYLPRVPIRYFDRRQRANRIRQVAMFPGYVFVLTSDPRAVAPRGPSFIGFLRNADLSFAVMDADAMARVRMMEDEMAVAEPVEPGDRPQVNIGDLIAVANDAFYKHKLVVREIRGDRVYAETPGSPFGIQVDIHRVRVA